MPDLLIQGSSTKVTEVPDRCPICQVYVIPQLLYGLKKDYKNMVAVFLCTNNRCREVFMAYYYGIEYANTSSPLPKLYKLDSLAPKNISVPDIDKHVVNLSPNFAEIYTQALQAESLGLDQICGPGYRKSLEFLVKDYLIHKNPDQVIEIKSKMLMPCINTITDENIKFAAQRATWIGNDETHYVRKWEEKDVTDLKLLIDLTINFIKNELIMERFKEEMPNGR
ncbi:hypothetical protein [Paenibacillus taichungensis]|uniref:hypothetical protein n=1 Tax=Paenibacillus taichungensis TaxID=484184 RepID=UPI0039A41414